MRKYILPVFIVLLITAAVPASAQVRVFYGYPRRPHHRRELPPSPPFTPSLDLSVGYGFPNLDKYALPFAYNYQYQGNASQMMGPITAALDYHFARPMSLGILVTHGTSNIPYYNYSNGALGSTAYLDNYSVMLDLINYLPYYNDNFVPYFRLAAGANIWNQNYFTDASGNHINVNIQPDIFAYQLSLGAKVKLSPGSGFFIEAGYGKYILEGGLTFKFH